MFAANTLLVLVSLATFCTTLSTDSVRSVRYDGQKLARFPASSTLLKEAQKLHLDIWGKSKKFLDIRVTDRQLARLKKFSRNVKILKQNIQTEIDNETKRLQSVSIDASADWFSDYHRYADIVSWLKGLTSQYPKLITYTASIGKSVENRDIPVVRITGTNGTSDSKKSVYFEGLIHAREWVSGSTVQYLIYNLLTKYGTDSRISNLMDQVEFVIVPIVNPDGYEYTWTDDRLWRKNRGQDGSGVDLNRNWSDHWGDGGSSTDPNDETYMGPSAFSEPETTVVSAFFQTISNVIGAIDFHSYSELILYPYGWTEPSQLVSPDDAKFIALGNEVQSAIASVSGTEYTPEHSAELYIASGCADDWFYGEGTASGKSRVYALTIELSPSSDDPDGYGFVLPPSEIVRVGNEILSGFLAYVEYALANPLPAKN